MNEEDARLAELDENLVRHDLNPFDRAIFLAERKKIYEAKNPQTKNGGAPGKAGGGKVAKTATIAEFACDTAERTGISDRAIRLSVSIANSLQPDVRARLAGTRFAKKQADLLALATLGPTEQRAAVDALLADGATSDSVRKTVNRVTGKGSKVTEWSDKATTAVLHMSNAELSFFLEFVAKRRQTEKAGWRLVRVGEAEMPPEPLPTPVDPAAEERARLAAALAEARAAGEYAGKHGRKQTDNPYNLRRREGQTWDAAWRREREAAAAKDSAA